MDVLKLLTYASGVVFVVAFAVKLIKYATMPMHVRWELYPVPHEGKAYGGSFYEDMDHWTKERHKNHMAQYKFMVPEILFIRALYEDNRPLWYWSFPFHMGLYLSIGGLVFLVIRSPSPDRPPDSRSVRAGESCAVTDDCPCDYRIRTRNNRRGRTSHQTNDRP